MGRELLQTQKMTFCMLLLQNQCATGNGWLSLSLVGDASNRDGIGARITLVTGESTQIREIRAGSGQMSQHAIAAHFGLGIADIIDSLTIRWPGGMVQTLMDVPVNQALTVAEPAR